MRCNLSRASGFGVGLELVGVVGTVEVDRDEIGIHVNGGHSAFVDQDAVGDLVEVGGQGGVDSVWIALFERTRQSETDVGVVNNDEAKGRNTRDNFLACTTDLVAADAERRGDIYKG